MKLEEWLQYYTGMALRGSMRPEKIAEMVLACGGQKRTMVKDPTDPSIPGRMIEQVEPFEEAVERIKGEILVMSSKASLERKADQIIVELRRR